MRKLPILTVLLLSLLVVPQAYSLNKCYTNVTKVKVPVVGVTITPFGERGVVGYLEVDIAYPGHGNIYVSSEPLTEVDTQGIARVAVLVASSLAHKDWTKYDFFFKFKTPSVIVGGPSAGIAMTVAVYSALTNQKPLPYVAGTGTVSPDATVGPVGGVYAKMRAAAESGFKVFVIPYGEEVSYLPKVSTMTGPFGAIIQKVTNIKVNLIEEGKKLGIKVIPVATVFDALKVWVPRPPKMPKVIEINELPDMLKNVVTKWTDIYLKQYKIYEAKTKGFTQQSLNLLQHAKTFAEEALKLKNTQPYQSVNMAFTAAILAEEAYWMDQVAVSGFGVLFKLASQAQESSANAMKAIQNNMIYDINKLDVLITAANRALKSLYFYHKAMNSTDLHEIIRYLVYAKYYSMATQTWLQLLNITPQGTHFSAVKLNKTADALYSSANGVIGYLLAMKIPIDEELINAIEIYKLASDKEAIFKLSAGMYLNALAAYTLHKYYSISLDNVLTKTKKASDYTLSMALENGIEPYVSILYNYSANKLQKDDPIDATLFYELSASHCIVLYQLK